VPENWHGRSCKNFYLKIEVSVGNNTRRPAFGSLAHTSSLDWDFIYVSADSKEIEALRRKLTNIGVTDMKVLIAGGDLQSATGSLLLEENTRFALLNTSAKYLPTSPGVATEVIYEDWATDLNVLEDAGIVRSMYWWHAHPMTLSPRAVPSRHTRYLVRARSADQ